VIQLRGVVIDSDDGGSIGGSLLRWFRMEPDAAIDDQPLELLGFGNELLIPIRKAGPQKVWFFNDAIL
jgi:hypothetical protein